MNNNHLLDREYFNIVTRNNNNYKNEEKNVQKQIVNNNIIYIDREKFNKNNNTEKKVNIYEDEKDKKMQNMRFNPYLIQYRNRTTVDRIGYNNENNKEEVYYKPYERNIKVENRNLNKLDFIDKDKKSEYYKNIDLKKFNPNINYKNFFKN